jgi:hypothetical protein
MQTRGMKGSDKSGSFPVSVVESRRLLRAVVDLDHRSLDSRKRCADARSIVVKE